MVYVLDIDELTLLAFPLNFNLEDCANDGKPLRLNNRRLKLEPREDVRAGM